MAKAQAGAMAARLTSCFPSSDASSSIATEFDPETDASVQTFRDSAEFARLDRIAHLITLCTPTEVCQTKQTQPPRRRRPPLGSHAPLSMSALIFPWPMRVHVAPFMRGRCRVVWIRWIMIVTVSVCML